MNINREVLPNLANTIGWMPPDALPCPTLGASGEIFFNPKNTPNELKTAMERLERSLNLISLKLNRQTEWQHNNSEYENICRELVDKLFPDLNTRLSQKGLFTPRETLGSFIDGVFETAKGYFADWIVDPSFMPNPISDRIQLHENVLNSRGLLYLVRLINKPGLVDQDPSAVLYSSTLRHEVYSLLGLTHEAAFIELDRTQEEDLYSEFVTLTSDFIPNLSKIWTWIKISPYGEWCKAGLATDEEEINSQIFNDYQGLVEGVEPKDAVKKRNHIIRIIKRIDHLIHQSKSGKGQAKIDFNKMAKDSQLSADDIGQLYQIYTELTSTQKILNDGKNAELIEVVYDKYRSLKRGRYYKIPFMVRPFGDGKMDFAYFYNRPKKVESEMFKRQRGRKVEDRIATTFVCYNPLITNGFIKFLRKKFDEIGPGESNSRWIILKETKSSKNPQAKRINTDKYKAIKIDFDKYLETLLEKQEQVKKENGGENSEYDQFMAYKDKAYPDMSISDLMFLFKDYQGLSVEVDVHTFTAGGDKQSWLQLEYGPDLNHNAMRARQIIVSGVMEHLRPQSLYGVDWDKELDDIIHYANQQALPPEFQFDIKEYLNTKS